MCKCVKRLDFQSGVRTVLHNDDEQTTLWEEREGVNPSDGSGFQVLGSLILCYLLIDFFKVKWWVIIQGKNWGHQPDTNRPDTSSSLIEWILQENVGVSKEALISCLAFETQNVAFCLWFDMSHVIRDAC